MTEETFEMNLAPTPQAQINVTERMLEFLERDYVDKPIASPIAFLTDPYADVAAYYNAFANVPGYQLPPVERFADKAAARAALTRLLNRLHDLFKIPKDSP